MSVAPEPHLRACLEVMYRAILEARVLGWKGDRLINRLSGKSHKRIASLMDAVHNIPHLLTAWEQCDQTRLRDNLVGHDEQWGDEGIRLSKVYDNALKEYMASKEDREGESA